MMRMKVVELELELLRGLGLRPLLLALRLGCSIQLLRRKDPMNCS